MTILFDIIPELPDDPGGLQTLVLCFFGGILSLKRRDLYGKDACRCNE
jgi:hypothetical protein